MLFNNHEFAFEVTCCRFSAFHMGRVSSYLVADYASADVGAQHTRIVGESRRAGQETCHLERTMVISIFISDFPRHTLNKVSQLIHTAFIKFSRPNRIRRTNKKLSQDCTLYVCAEKNAIALYIFSPVSAVVVVQ